MAKILVADDEADFEALVKQKFRKQIRDEEYQFTFSANGSEALIKLMESKDFEVLLTDLNMPEMDGLTLLGKLEQLNLLTTPVVVSAYGDMQNIRNAMNRGAFDFICKPVNFEDLHITIEKTLQHVRKMEETLEAIKENNILKMYVDDTVLNFMGNKEFETSLMQNETIEATIAFIDICGFTAISENGDPNAVVRLLNQYFDVMAGEIINQDGHIDKFIGDAILAVFKGKFHLDRGIDACLALKRQIENLPAQNEIPGFVPNVSIGIHCGEVISGNIGSAKLRRLDYTVIGDVVNTAQRLQSVAEPGAILITESSYEVVRNSFRCRKVGEAKLRNKSLPVVVYEVLE